jgi:hypothetical protein
LRLLDDAASRGYFDLVRWCHEQGCPWLSVSSAPLYAAESGNVELMAWVLQQPGALAHMDVAVMRTAAMEGHTAMVQYLHAQQCPWNDATASDAAVGGHVDVSWLMDNGCPWDVGDLCKSAVQGGSVKVLAHLQQRGLLSSTEVLTELLNTAAGYNRLAAAKWLREQGAEWPAAFAQRRPGLTVLVWARTEGYSPPTN